VEETNRTGEPILFRPKKYGSETAASGAAIDRLPNQVSQDLGALLRKLRKGAGLTQPELSKKLNPVVASASEAWLSKCERGEGIPSNHLVEEILRCVGAPDDKKVDAMRLRSQAATTETPLYAALRNLAGVIEGKDREERENRKLAEALQEAVRYLCEEAAPHNGATVAPHVSLRFGFNLAAGIAKIASLEISTTGREAIRNVVVMLPGPKCAEFAILTGEQRVAFAYDPPKSEGNPTFFVEYQDHTKQHLFLQIVTIGVPPGPAIPISKRVLFRLREWYDVAAFIGETLGLDIPPIWSADPPIAFAREGDAYEIGSLRVSKTEVESDYKPLTTSIVDNEGFTESIIYSESVNRCLREGTDVPIKQDMHQRDRLEKRLRQKAQTFADALFSHYTRSSKHDKRFFCEPKTCLGSDLLLRDGKILPVAIFRGSYYHSFLTNEMVTKRLESDEGDGAPESLYSGWSDFPIDPYSRTVRPIGASNMGNHIGASTLLFTADGTFQIWRQKRSGQVDAERRAATGSGSCDWEDWKQVEGRTPTLHSLISTAMERELCEESGLLGVPAHIETRLVGYFRWIKRGGKPEFVGISKTSVHSTDLVPTDDVQLASVGNMPDRLTFPAQNVSELEESIEYLLRKPGHLSLPLWMILTLLGDLVRTRDKAIFDFLSLT
jgi:transcriptional regulator with XRE-family HTH domain